jgi:hypothetical protein
LRNKKRKYKRKRTPRNNGWKYVFFGVVVLLMFGLFLLFSGNTTRASQIEENRKDIILLRNDVDDVKTDLEKLSDRFDKFFYQNLEMMIEMKQAIDSAVRDESVNVELSNIGNAESGSESLTDMEYKSRSIDKSAGAGKGSEKS